ncbi:PREDICTED: titin-like, partial [Branchiostoma belcheri]|uniref:Titin-like n=1 Tax=Branchiostoma belcheri TaxID=7741 RepID=A0A6P5A0V4_BRABE
MNRFQLGKKSKKPTTPSHSGSNSTEQSVSAFASKISPDAEVQAPLQNTVVTATAATEESQVKTDIPDPPDPPKGFQVVDTSTDFIKLKWAKVTSKQIYGYRLERSIAFQNKWSRAHQQHVLSAQTTSFQVGKVVPYEAYDFCVKSAALDDSSGTLLYNGGPKLRNVIAKGKDQPFPPRDVKVKEVKEESVSLTWLVPEPDNSQVTCKYVVEMCSDYTDSKILNTWEECSNSPTTECQCTVKVQHNGNYRFRVKALNSDKPEVRSLPQEMGDPEVRIHIKQRNTERGFLEQLLRLWNFFGTTPERQEDGSIIFVISCQDMSGLRELWMNYNLGKLKEFFQDLFAQEHYCPASDLTNKELDIKIDPEDFYACRRHLLLTCPNSKGFRVLKVGDTYSRACTKLGLSEDYPVHCKPVLQRTAFSELDFLDLAITVKKSTGVKPSSTTCGTVERSPGIM